MRNKKIIGALLAVTTLATFGLAGCGNSGPNDAASKEDDKTITVAASPTPHAEILNKAAKPLVEKDGYKLVVKEFTDYVQPNTATEDGEGGAHYSTTSTRRRARIWCPWRASTSSRSACTRARPRS